MHAAFACRRFPAILSGGHGGIAGAAGALAGRCLFVSREGCAGMSGVSGKELELKLELTPEELQRVGAHPALEQSDGRKAGHPDPALRSISTRPTIVCAPKASRCACARSATSGCRPSRAARASTNGVSNPDEVEAVVRQARARPRRDRRPQGAPDDRAGGAPLGAGAAVRDHRHAHHASAAFREG